MIKSNPHAKQIFLRVRYVLYSFIDVIIKAKEKNILWFIAFLDLEKI